MSKEPYCIESENVLYCFTNEELYKAILLKKNPYNNREIDIDKAVHFLLYSNNSEYLNFLYEIEDKESKIDIDETILKNIYDFIQNDEVYQHSILLYKSLEEKTDKSLICCVYIASLFSIYPKSIKEFKSIIDFNKDILKTLETTLINLNCCCIRATPLRFLKEIAKKVGVDITQEQIFSSSEKIVTDLSASQIASSILFSTILSNPKKDRPLTFRNKLETQNSIAKGLQAEIFIQNNEIIKRTIFGLDSPLIELSIIQLLEHPNIIKSRGFYFEMSETSMIVDTFLDKLDTDLSTYIYIYRTQTNKLSFPKRQIQKTAKQLLSAINYCHERNIAHLDLKTSNILVQRKEYKVVVADFGLSAFISDLPLSLRGSLFWLAPEILKDRKIYYPKQADIWAIGIILCQMYCDMPYFGEDFDALLNNIDSLSLSDFFQKHAINLVKEEFDFISKLLEQNPKLRISAEDALNHPFFSL